MKITLNECPRPQMVRKSWKSLNGKWDFAFDYEGKGLEMGYQNGFKKQHDILVPFAYETKASGIGITKRCDHVWYQKTLNIRSLKNRQILHLEGSDYVTTVYCNGKKVGEHVGAYARSSYDLTSFLNLGNNLIVISCDDDYSMEKPRGKQRHKDENYECFYVDTTGIYKEVWIEEVGQVYIKHVKMTPNAKEGKMTFEFELSEAFEGKVKSKITFNGEKVKNCSAKVNGANKKVAVKLPEPVKLWDLENPNLYEVTFALVKDRKTIDSVASYFGVRDIKAENGFVYLNDKKLYQKLVLDQGYWLDSHLTAPDNAALKFDIDKMVEYGFNGCRKHQKTEDERFLYYADVMGYIVWAEMASMFKNTPKARKAFEPEWLEAVAMQYNHPCVITWTPFNESWGIEEVKKNKTVQAFVDRIVRLTKKYDKTRFVISNDGWEHTTSSLITMHHYEQNPEILKADFGTKEKCLQEKWDGHGRGPLADGYEYKGQPILLTEFGGTAYVSKSVGGAWGYGVGVKDDKEYIERVTGMLKGLGELPHIAGYCYTQVSDVQQEVNGLLTEDRKDKVSSKPFKEVQDKIHY